MSIGGPTCSGVVIDLHKSLSGIDDVAAHIVWMANSKILGLRILER